VTDAEEKTEPRPVYLPRRWVGVAVLTLLAPAWIVLLTYLYERGYAGVFAIDKTEIELSTTLMAAIAIRFLQWLALAALIVQTVSFGMARVRFRSSALMYGYVVGEALLVGALLYWAVWDWDLDRLAKGLVYASGIGVVLAVAAFGFRLLGRHERPEEPNLGRLATRLIDSGYFPVVAAVVISAFAANWAGTADASREQYFQVLRSDPSIVVLRRYDDRLIAARQMRAGVIERDVRHVMVVGGPGQRQLERRKLGELRPAGN
jgi:hypothetical protein